MKKLTLLILFIAGLTFCQDWPEPENVNGFITDLDDVTITWDRPIGAKVATLVEYVIYRNGDSLDVVSESLTTYDDIDVASGTYTYTLKGVYLSPDGVSIESNVYNAVITADPTYWVPSNFNAATQGRQAIDLSWTTPFNQVHWLEEDWESGSFGTDWVQRRSTSFPPEMRAFQNATVDDPKWFEEDGTIFGAEYVHGGSYSAAIDYNAPGYTWLFSPEFSISDTPNLRYWQWATGDSTSEKYTNYHVVIYTGDFSENKPADDCYTEASFMIDQSNENRYSSAVELNTSNTYDGTCRLAFVYEQSNGFELAIDDIDLFSSSMQTGFEVYRDEVKIADTVESYYSDTNFADGVNEYYVKANFFEETSIASNRDTAIMDANPAPWYLTGEEISYAEVELNWYAPYHYPPMWFGYNGDTADSFWDMFQDYFGPGQHAQGEKNRTLFNMDLGIYYPAVVDSISVAFYEDPSSPWASDQFTFSVYTSAYDGSDSLLIAPSPNMTAVSGEWTKYALASYLVMDQGWWIEVTPGDAANTGTPSILTSHVENSHSTSYLDAAGDGSGYGWYTIGAPDDLENEWWINAYITSATPPPIAKNGWIKDPVTEINKSIDKVDSKKVNLSIEKLSKGMLNYNIYCGGSLEGTSILTTFIHNIPIPLKNIFTYYVTALYDNPAGESDPSNEVMLDIEIYNPFLNVITSAVGNTLRLDWNELVDATGYYVYEGDDPYGNFTIIDTVAVNQWETTITEGKQFYYVVGTNDTKEPLKEIEVKESVMKR